jgi:C_GCAxxG_C_C family probable redox protein
MLDSEVLKGQMSHRQGNSTLKSGLSEDHTGELRSDNVIMDAEDIGQLVREVFVTEDNLYGCAETSYIALKHTLDLPRPDDSTPAMALNGGVAYQGGVCGAITGAALAAGELAGRRIADHKTAKRVARYLTQGMIEGFVERFGTVECRDLIGFDLRQPGEHERFIDSGIWRERCASQIEYATSRLAELASQCNFEAAVADIGDREQAPSTPDSPMTPAEETHGGI